MAIDITGLRTLEQRSPEIIGKLLNKDTVLKLFVAHEGYNPGPALLRLYQGGGALQACCTIPERATEFSEIATNVACIMSGNEYCEQDLAKYLNDLKFRFTAGNESIDASLEKLIMEQELAKVAINLDRLVFQGDCESADDNLNHIDGLIKQAQKSAETKKININSGNIYTAIQQIILSLPYEAYDMGDVAILVSRDVAQNLQLALMSMNLYHYNPGSKTLDEEIEFPGFSGVKIIPARGLDKTGIAIATPLSNIHWLTNLADDYMNLDWDYNKYHQLYYWRVKFLLGLTFGILENVVIADLADDVVKTMPSFPVSIISPLSANGGLLIDAEESVEPLLAPMSASVSSDPTTASRARKKKNEEILTTETI